MLQPATNIFQAAAIIIWFFLFSLRRSEVLPPILDLSEPRIHFHTFSFIMSPLRALGNFSTPATFAISTSKCSPQSSGAKTCLTF